MRRIALFLCGVVMSVGVVVWMQSTDCYAATAKKAPPKATQAPPPPPPPPVGAPPAAVMSNSPEQKQVADIQTVFAAGEYDKVIASAQAYIASGKEDPTKTEAIRLIAESLRKKGEWKQLPAAYSRLRDRYDKTKDEWVRLDGLVEVARGSPNGVYVVGMASGGPKPVGPTPVAAAATGTADPASALLAGTIAEDSVLVKGMTRVAVGRLRNLKSKLAAIKAARTAPDVVTQFTAAAETAKQILLLSNDVPPDQIRELGLAAGARLQELAAPMVQKMEDKLARYQPKMTSPWLFTNVEKKDITDSSGVCKQIAEAETSFLQSLAVVAVKPDWPEADRLRKESADRKGRFDNLAKELVVPPWTTIYF